MHAIRQHEFGAAENLRYESAPDPAPDPDQVRIAVRAAGVHLVDTEIRSGRTSGPWQLPQLPMIPGREVAGVVDQLGADVPQRWLGKRVVAHLGMASAGYAELAVANVDALHQLPDTLAFDHAVAMMGTGRMTQGILALAQPAAGETVLVTAAAGGIGTLLVQAARNAGAFVIGAAGGPAKVERVEADLAVDYAEPDWTNRLGDRQIDLLLDGVGGAEARAAFERLKTGGRIVLFGWSSGKELAFSSSEVYEKLLTVTVALGPSVLRQPGGLRALEERSLAEAAAGRLVPAVQTFPLAEAATAHRALESRATVGKVVLLP
ncbi:zinc-binding dehydrogenase [Tenggerimyces flavus]|uniref:Zinc-binding dehydrogenase n=1 Tax=Tenggerimyces flavus TaxID=1708749 RepID=A0ABV7YE54_9ACTN|nr:zinc-binding dehydrogenase [Tenggerimyces flavus]MBM7783407.1 NADPH2:quinone reductase [Tenggerimyces flavus]